MDTFRNSVGQGTDIFIFPFERAVLKYFSCQIFLQLYCTTERCTFGVLHDISKLDVYF